jgi:4-carboxymuconolactone decarboxylase
MGRLKPIPKEKLTPAQKKILDSRPNGRVRGPSSVWLMTPELEAHVAPLMEHLRTKTTLDPRLSELAMLVPLRAWTAQFGWLSHERIGLEVGLDKAVIEAIKNRERPTFTKDDEQVVYALASEIVDAKKVSDMTYGRAVARLGEAAVVEVVSTVGFYMMVAAILSTFRVDVPEGVTPALKD